MHYKASPNFDRRTVSPDMVILHYTGLPSAEESLARLCDPASKVSAHYLIDEKGNVTQMVDEESRAWHAGVSSWRGERDINSRSIGIELQNPGHEFGYRPFPEDQICALLDLLQGITARWNIPSGNYLGHSDVAPERKKDPGELFPWNVLAKAGFGLWMENVDGINDPNPVEDSKAFLKDAYHLGYGKWDNASIILAFQRHWRPAHVSGKLDSGTVMVMKSLLEKN